MKKQHWYTLITIAPWLLTVLGSFLMYNLVFSMSPCAFMSFWPYCDSLTSVQMSIRIIVLATIFGLFALQSWLMWTKEDYRSWLWERRTHVYWLLPLFALCCLPFTSADTMFYYHVGNAAQTINPYLEYRVTTNPFLFPFTDSTSVGVMYGPITVRLMAIVSSIANGSYLMFLGVWKILLALSMLLFVKVVRHYTPTSKQTMFVFMLAPLVLWEWLAVGHFDVLWLLPVVLAYVFAKKGQWIWVWPMLTIGIWIKFLPLLFVPWFFLWWIVTLQRSTIKSSLFNTIIGVLAAGLLSIVVWQPYWTDLSVLSTIGLQSKWAIHSVFASVYYMLKPMAEVIFAGNYHWWLTRAVHGALFAFVVYLLWPQLLFVWRALRKPSSATKEMILWSMLYTFSVFLFVWQKSFWPWYALWPIALSFLLPPRVQKKYEPVTVWLLVSSMMITGIYQFGFHQAFLVPFTVMSTLAIQVPVIYHLVKLRSYLPTHEIATNT